jgi:ABC-type cobalamin/Fe3+-siderophores transport system ATPase subunit
MVTLGRFRPRGFSKWRLSSQDRATVDACLARCQIDKLGDRRLNEISGGEQKCAWLAFGLALDKKYLMLDETLDSMDIFVKRTFFQLLKDIASQDKSISLTSHDLDMVNDFTDKIIVLIGGKVVFEGPPDSDLQRLLSDTPESARITHGDGK